MFRSILDPQFKYRNAASTDVRETFERVRREQDLGGSSAGQPGLGSDQRAQQEQQRNVLHLDLRRRLAR